MAPASRRFTRMDCWNSFANETSRLRREVFLSLI
jgi:hypothetical protein